MDILVTVFRKKILDFNCNVLSARNVLWRIFGTENLTFTAQLSLKESGLVFKVGRMLAGFRVRTCSCYRTYPANLERWNDQIGMNFKLNKSVAF